MGVVIARAAVMLFAVLTAAHHATFRAPAVALACLLLQADVVKLLVRCHSLCERLRLLSGCEPSLWAQCTMLVAFLCIFHRRHRIPTRCKRRGDGSWRDGVRPLARPGASEPERARGGNQKLTHLVVVTVSCACGDGFTLARYALVRATALYPHQDTRVWIDKDIQQ